MVSVHSSGRQHSRGASGATPVIDLLYISDPTESRGMVLVWVWRTTFSLSGRKAFRYCISVVHTATPHNARMKIFLILGRATPSQTLPAGRGKGKPGFPMSQPHSWEGDALPNPPRREGEGETRFPHVPTAFLGGRRPPKPSPQGGGWGNPVSPCPNRILGRATPSQTLPAGRGMGKPGFPMSQPLVGAAGAPTGRGLGTPRFPVCSPQEAWGERILSHLRKHSTFGEAKTLQSSVPYNPE